VLRFVLAGVIFKRWTYSAVVVC